MDKILTLLDGSAYSESVCHHTAWIAEKLNASVTIMHVLGRREGVASTDLSGTLSLGARTSLLEELSALDEQRRGEKGQGPQLRFPLAPPILIDRAVNGADGWTAGSADVVGR